MSEASKYAPVPGRIPGAVVNMGGHDLVLAPLNLDGVQAAKPLQDRLAVATEHGEIIRCAAELLHLSLVRNYPDMTASDVQGLLDLHNLNEAVSALTTQSGYKRATPGELTPASP